MFLKRKPKVKRTVDERGSAAGAEPTQALLQDEHGLYHLWYLELRLDEELVRAARTENVFSLVTWQLRLLPGETPGVDLLRRAAAIIIKGVRSYDIPSRIDKERFTALILDADYEQASTAAFRIKGDLQLQMPSAGTWRAGVATFRRDGLDDDALISTALRRLQDDARAA